MLTVQAKFCRPELQTGPGVDAAYAVRKSWGSELFGFRNSNQRRALELLSARWLLPEAGPQCYPVSLCPPPVSHREAHRTAALLSLGFIPGCPTKNKLAPANDYAAVLLEPQLVHL